MHFGAFPAGKKHTDYLPHYDAQYQEIHIYGIFRGINTAQTTWKDNVFSLELWNSISFPDFCHYSVWSFYHEFTMEEFYDDGFDEVGTQFLD